jgi:large subunit ribosomal protein L35
LPFPLASALSATFKPPGQSGLPWRFVFARFGANAARLRACPLQESQMPKLKTKSGAKKRFKVTGTGKVIYTQAGKRHGMIKRTNKQLRDHRGTAVLFKSDGDKVKRFFLPNG